jgi:hypothetical protein
MILQFFFGVIHDVLKETAGNHFITRYIFLLPFIALVFLFLFWKLNRSNSSFENTSRYLTTSLIVFIVFDLFQFVFNRDRNSFTITNISESLAKCDTCSKPNIFVIVADEYAGNQELKEIFNFDNSAFETDLKQREFHIIPNSRSNYNHTQYSVASFLNLSFLPIKDSLHASKDIIKVMRMAYENKLQQFFRINGYTFTNLSGFDMEDHPGQSYSALLPHQTSYISDATFTKRIERDIFFNLFTRFNLKWAISEKAIYYSKKANEYAVKTTIEISKEHRTPQFVYTHLAMPHFPYLFDEAGKIRSAHEVVFRGRDTQLYIPYLKYANNQILKLIDQILENSTTPPIILFISDHGYRWLQEPFDKRYLFMNIEAVYTPDKKYSGYYNGISLVNVFRVLLNEEFGQKLKILPDRTNYLVE